MADQIKAPDPIKLQFRPGINRETTDYSNTGGWYDCNLTRWNSGSPETVGGWTKFTAAAAQGTFRSLFPFSNLNGSHFYGAGTNLKYYLIGGNTLNDITPIRASSTINNNPFAIVSGDATCTVTDTSHGAVVGDFVTFTGAATIGASNVTGTVLNAEYQITSVTDANTYTFELSVTSDTTDAAGGGASVVAAYQINVGLNTSATGNGWGTSAWGGSLLSIGWGQGSTTYVSTDRLRLWSQDNWGEDLIFNVRNDAIYYKDMSGSVSTRGTYLTAITGASDVPTIARQVLVSDNDRHAIAFGANTIGTSVQDRQLIRWCDGEDLANWTPDTTNTAGSLRIDVGSEIVTAVETTTETLVFTDVSLHSFKYIGSPYVFGQVRVGENIRITGPNAAVSTGSETFWMAKGAFQMYDGVVRDMPCNILTHIRSIVNTTQDEKIVAGINRRFSEVIWLIPANGSDELNYYVICNYEDRTNLLWYYGDFNDAGRTTWLDAWYEGSPLAAGTDGYIYSHDVGDTDGSTTPGTMLDSWVQSSVFEIGNGTDFMLVSRTIPDVNFQNSTGASPQVTITFGMRENPGSTTSSAGSKTVTRTVDLPVEEYTDTLDKRFRAKSAYFKVSATAAGTFWQLGTPRLYANPDGQR